VLVDPDEAKAGDEFLVMPGERVPLDGEVVEGECFVDTSALTGESLPRRIEPGSEVFAGGVAVDGSFTAIARSEANESAAARIIRLVEGASRSKARAARLVTRFASVYTPIVVASAAALAFLPPLLVPGQRLADWVYRALVLLVISCPCALVVSVPLGYFCGMGAAAKRGILVKGAEVLDSLAKARTIAFDKTGTLTKGSFRLLSIIPEEGFGENDILALAAAAESRSRHPVAASIRAAAAARGLSVGVEDEASVISERPGAGVAALVGGRRVLAGNDRLLHLESVSHSSCEADGTTINVAVDGILAGRIIVGDEAKPDAGQALRELTSLGVSRLVMLTGDSAEAARPIAENLGLSEVAADLLPEGKLAYVEQVVAETAALGGTTVFVGDGVNDAPSLARADVGVAMGAGSDAAIERADLVLMTNELSRLPEALRSARRTRRVVAEGIFLCLAFKAVFLGLGAIGLAGMWEAVIADVGVAILAIFNALRAMR
jgi:Cd2+/Zn2+-exporting ATPase